MSQVTGLCPSCALRDATTPEGWCAPCVLERRAEEFTQRDSRQAALRRSSWGARTKGDHYAKLRRQRKRLTDAVRPRSSDPGGDPWIIAKEAIHNLQHMRQKDAVTIENVVEAIRRLAWGPDEPD